MEFQKERCYTAVNADELEAGDMVIVADTLAQLQRHVATVESVHTLMSVEDSDKQYRFNINFCTYFALAYLIAKHDDPYKEFAKAQVEGRDIWYRNNDGEWNPGKNYSFSYPVERYSLNHIAEAEAFLKECDK